MKKGIWAVVIFFLLLANAYVYLELDVDERDQEPINISETDVLKPDTNLLLFIAIVSVVLIVTIIFWVLKPSHF